MKIDYDNLPVKTFEEIQIELREYLKKIQDFEKRSHENTKSFIVGIRC